MSETNYGMNEAASSPVEVAPDPSEEVPPVDVIPDVDEEHDDFDDFDEIGELTDPPVFLDPAPPILEEQPVPDAQGIISLDKADNFIVVCDTPDCPNQGEEIEVVAVKDDPIVQCGPCGELITDVRSV